MANPGHVSIRCFTHCVQSYRFTFLVQEGHCCNRNYQNPCGDLRCNFGFLLVQAGAGIWLHQQGQSAKESWQAQQGWEGHLRLSPPKPVRGRWQAGVWLGVVYEPALEVALITCDHLPLPRAGQDLLLSLFLRSVKVEKGEALSPNSELKLHNWIIVPLLVYKIQPYNSFQR